MTVTKPEPYLGISGVAAAEQHQAILEMADRHRIGRFGHFVMIGIQATNKTQLLEIENKRGRLWHPVGDEISRAAINDGSELTRPYIHCYFEDDSQLSLGLDVLMHRTADYCKGVQINGLPWVDTDFRPVLHEFRRKYPDQAIIIQANKAILNSHSPSQVADQLASMPVDYVLFDPSGGYGIKLRSAEIKQFVDEIYQRQLPVGTAIAGGLEAGNLEELFGPLAELYADISCDGEGRFRKGPEGQTVIDLSAVEAYMLAWQAIQNRLDKARQS